MQERPQEGDAARPEFPRPAAPPRRGAQDADAKTEDGENVPAEAAAPPTRRLPRRTRDARRSFAQASPLAPERDVEPARLQALS